MVWIETPTNPTLQVVDIAAVSAIAHRQEGVIVVVDNTFATAYFQVSGMQSVLYTHKCLCHSLFGRNIQNIIQPSTSTIHLLSIPIVCMY